jgi:hypothetical protein
MAFFRGNVMYCCNGGILFTGHGTGRFGSSLNLHGNSIAFDENEFDDDEDEE